MKKYIVSLIAAATAAALPSAHAAATATNVVQNISISLEFVSQVAYTNNGVTEGFLLTDVSRTNRTAKATNITETVTETYKAVTRKYANRDIVAALNPDLAGGTLVRVWTLTSFGDISFYEPQFQIRKGSTVYDVPSEGTGSISFSPTAFVEVGKGVITTNTLYKGTSVSSVATTNSSVSILFVGTLTLNTPTISCTVTGAGLETGEAVPVAGTVVHVQNFTASTVAGTGSDADGANEVVSGSVLVNGAKAEN